MQAKLVSTIGDTTQMQVETWFINTAFERDTFVGAMQQKGFWQHGVHKSPTTREELQGQPKFIDLCGPMYDGPGLVRYETKKANEILSF